VYRVAPDLAVVQTLDFFMPFVDDPFDYGRIAAANSISDVYAMGGRPILALAIVGLPIARVSADVMAQVLDGAQAICREAGIPIAGGHSIDDAEMKFGLAVTGLVHPDRVLRNSSARPGDWLVLTKPLGTGTLGSAVKKKTIRGEEYAELVRCASFLNRIPSEVALDVGVHSATDVTGFSLLGHGHGMAAGSGLSAELWMDALPVLPGAREHIANGLVPGATARNLNRFGEDCDWDLAVGDDGRRLIADPQTSGGLLLAVDTERRDRLVGALRDRGALAAAVVGRMLPRQERTLRVRARRPAD
jgi:selenide,water dikinase